MTIEKPDFNNVFASQAPESDNPPKFDNYSGGWGSESRPNNGKPTIKGANFIQMRNDNKFLWMHQNGVFPYDSNIKYSEGVISLKDGRFKQLTSGNWVNFGQDDGALKTTSNLSDLQDKEVSRANLDVYSKTEAMAKSDLNDATVEQKGIVQLVNDLTTGGIAKALTAEQGKLLFEMFTNSLSVSGFVRIPNPTLPNSPFILQWGSGQVAVSANTSKSVSASFPVSFPNNCLSVMCKNQNIVGSDVTAESWNITGFAGYARNEAATTIKYTFWAVGY